MVLLDNFNEKRLEKIQIREDTIDKMEERVTSYLVSLGTLDLSDYENTSVTSLMRIEAEIEKVGDYSYRLAKTIEHMNENDIKVSKKAREELQNLYNLTEDILIRTIKIIKTRDLNGILDTEALKEIAEIKREEYKSEHIRRLKEGLCNVESGISFLEILTIFEKIVYHCVNATIAVSNMVKNENFITKQDFSRRIYEDHSDKLKEKLNEYSLKNAG